MSIMRGMKVLGVLNLFFSGGLFFGRVLLFGCGKQAGATPPSTPPASGATVDFSEPQEAQPKLPTIKLWLGPEQMDAEMASTGRQMQTGMMFRRTMGENDGMIFGLFDT